MNIIEAIEARSKGASVYRHERICDKHEITRWIPFIDIEKETFTLADIVADDWQIKEDLKNDKI